MRWGYWYALCLLPFAFAAHAQEGDETLEQEILEELINEAASEPVDPNAIDPNAIDPNAIDPNTAEPILGESVTDEAEVEIEASADYEVEEAVDPVPDGKEDDGIKPVQYVRKTIAKETAHLRFLDRLNAQTEGFDLVLHEKTTKGALEITLEACVVPADSPKTDALGFLRIQDTREAGKNFSGWMLASSPALSAFDHPRYDVWVVSCS